MDDGHDMALQGMMLQIQISTQLYRKAPSQRITIPICHSVFGTFRYNDENPSDFTTVINDSLVWRLKHSPRQIIKKTARFLTKGVPTVSPAGGSPLTGQQHNLWTARTNKQRVIAALSRQEQYLVVFKDARMCRRQPRDIRLNPAVPAYEEGHNAVIQATFLHIWIGVAVVAEKIGSVIAHSFQRLGSCVKFVVAVSPA